MKQAGKLLSAVLLVCAVAATASPQSDESIMRMAEKIRKEIVRLPNYGVFDHLSFGIRGSTIYLRGFASRPTLKSSAERVARNVEGVEEVKNEIEVLSLSGVDDDVRAGVYVAIYGHPSLRRYDPSRGSPIFMSRARAAAGITNDPPIGFHPIHIIVHKGHVTLEGAVDTAGDKAIAGIQANGVFGVFGVTNDLVVTSKEND